MFYYILVTIYVYLDVKPLKESPYVSYTKNYVNMVKSSRIRILPMVVFKNHSDT